jgi:hypothetical protein
MMFTYDIRSDLFHVDCIQTFPAFDNVERNMISFVDLINKPSNMNKNLLFGVVQFNETETFGGVKKFNRACFHSKIEVKSTKLMESLNAAAGNEKKSSRWIFTRFLAACIHFVSN